MQTNRSGFLVTDGHHNRVLRVRLDGEISDLIALHNVVPTELAVLDNTVYTAEARPVPHRPQDGKLVAFRPGSPTARGSRPAHPSWSTWSLGADAASTRFHRELFREVQRDHRRCRTLARL